MRLGLYVAGVFLQVVSAKAMESGAEEETNMAVVPSLWIAPEASKDFMHPHLSKQ